MNLVVDISVWSLVLRRPRVDETNPHVRAFRHHVDAGDGLFLIGNILQELLDGLRSPKEIDRLAALLEPFPLLELNREIYVVAARLCFACRSRGIIDVAVPAGAVGVEKLGRRFEERSG